MDDYLFKLSCARIQFMAIDNTHTKYLKGADKSAWNNYGDIVKAQKKLENYFESFNVPKLKAGEEYEVPVPKRTKKKPKKEKPMPDEGE